MWLYTLSSVALMPVMRMRRVLRVPSPAMSTSIVSPSATSVTLPVQNVQVGPPGTHLPVDADAGAASTSAATTLAKNRRIPISHVFGTPLRD